LQALAVVVTQYSLFGANRDLAIQSKFPKELNMPHLSLKAGAAVCALTLLGFAGHANAAPRPMLDTASSLTILAGDEENSEVQNLLDPESDNGLPGGPAAMEAKPAPEGESHEEKAMEAKPSGGVDDSTEVDKEEGK
jgi:hypothetical protein